MFVGLAKCVSFTSKACTDKTAKNLSFADCCNYACEDTFFTTREHRYRELLLTCMSAGASLGRAGVSTDPSRIYDTNFSPVNCTLIKRETVLLLKEQYVAVGLVGQTMHFANIS